MTGKRLAALVDARLRGQGPPAPAPEEAPALALLDALRQSVVALQPPPAPEAAAAAGAKGTRRARRTSP